jgi:hypothetical protein
MMHRIAYSWVKFYCIKNYIVTVDLNQIQKKGKKKNLSYLPDLSLSINSNTSEAFLRK